MKKKLITILIVVTFGVICSVLSAYYTTGNINHAHAMSLANSILYDLSYVVDALDELKKSESAKPVVLDKLETILVASLVSLRTTNPEIENLQGTPINTLCRIIKYDRDIGIAKNGIGKTFIHHIFKTC